MTLELVNLGIIGQGFVGSAVNECLKDFYNIATYDIDGTKCNSTHQQVCAQSSIIFVCVPTPMHKNGSCDTRILESVINKIDEECRNDESRNRPIIVIKSTVPPGMTRVINSHSILDVCFSPEFLTEANSFKDFEGQTRIIIGGDESGKCAAAKKVKAMFRKPFPAIPIIVTKFETAEMVKYFTNCFLATKVTFANEMYNICQNANIDYDKVCEYVLYDDRVGKSHLAVPGPDGDTGFGGHCFPKDLAALIFFGKNNNARVSFLQQVESSNLLNRGVKDWVAMKGRAVSDD